MSANQQQLKSILQREIEYTNALLDDLNAEKKILGVADVSAFEKITANKRHLVKEIEILEIERNNLLSDAGNIFDHEDVGDYLESTTGDNQLTVLWRQLLTLARQVHRQNLVNGSIMKGLRHRMRDTLFILRGRQPGEYLYDENGAHDTDTSTLPLTKA